MSSKTYVLALFLLVSLAASTLGAQWVERPYYRVPASTLPAFQLTFSAGYMDFGRYINGPLGTNVPLPNGPELEGQASLSLTRNVAIYGELGFASSQQHLGPEESGLFNGATTGFWLYDGGIQLMAPFKAEDRHWLVPFVQAGAGGVSYRLYSLNTGNPGTDNRFAWNGGVGLDYHFTRQVGFRLMAKDYIAMFNVPHTVTVLNPGGPEVSPSSTTKQITAQDNNNNYAFTAGLNIGF
jgi:opacity protein-like surface antigen